MHLIVQFILHLEYILAGTASEMYLNTTLSSSLLTAVFALSLSSVGISALPASPLSPSLSTIQVNTSAFSSSLNTRPPGTPLCPGTDQGVTLGHPSYDDCDYILSNLYPKDPLARPVLRNFYSASTDVSHTLNNFRLPYEQSYSITAPSFKAEV